MGPIKQNRRRRQAGQHLCICCSTPFTPHVRLKARQLTCSAECRKKRRATKMQAWRKNHPGYNKPRKHPPGFWKQYRASHPEGAARNREQSRLRAKLRRKSLQRNLELRAFCWRP